MSLSTAGQRGGGGDLADPPSPRPNQPPTQIRKKLPPEKNEILNTVRKMRGLGTRFFFALIPSHLSPPRMVMCELLRVLCCLGRRQHNRQHMQSTRMREKLVKSLKTARGAFRKRSGRGMCARTFCGGERATSSSPPPSRRPNTAHHPSGSVEHWCV